MGDKRLLLSLNHSKSAPDTRDSESIAVSTSFHPTSHSHLPPTDLIFVSQDDVVFYLHSSVLLNASTCAFQNIIGSSLIDRKHLDASIRIALKSYELNVILHMIYDISLAGYSPTVDILTAAVDKLPTLSFSPPELVHPKSHFYKTLLTVAPLYPLEIYMLASHHKIYDLAVCTSAYLLSFPLEDVTVGQAERMGAIYFQKLVSLRATRFKALRNILLQPPHPHPPTSDCGFSEQDKLTRAWAMASAYIIWDGRLGMDVRCSSSLI